VAVPLIKIVNGNLAISSTLPNQQTVKCPRCELTYRFAYTDDEWNKVSAWLTKAERAMRESHKTGHEAATLVLRW